MKFNGERGEDDGEDGGDGSIASTGMERRRRRWWWEGSSQEPAKSAVLGSIGPRRGGREGGEEREESGWLCVEGEKRRAQRETRGRKPVPQLSKRVGN